MVSWAEAWRRLGRSVQRGWNASGVAAMVVTVAVGIGLLMLRNPAAVAHPQLWAEDGPVFYLTAAREGWGAFFIQYGGYFHLIPRVLGALAWWLDPAWTPHVFVFGSLAVTAGVMAMVFSPRLSWTGRPALALAVVLVAHTGEVFFTPTNVQWITALGLVITLLKTDPRTPAQGLADGLVLVAVGLTGPFVIFAVPLFLVRAWLRRSRASYAFLGVAVLLAAVQAWQVIHHTPPDPPWHPTESFRLGGALVALAGRLPLALFGFQTWSHLVTAWMAAALGLVAIGAILWSALRPDNARRERGFLLAFAALLLAFTVAKIRADTWPYGEMQHADRYFYIPKVILLWVLIASVERTSRRGWMAASILGICVVGSALTFQLPSQPFFPWRPFVEPLRRGETVEVAVSPGWRFTVPERVR